MKTFVIQGLVEKQAGRSSGDYADIEKVYNVEDGIDIEDIRYYFRSHTYRTAPARVFQGIKTSWFVGEDSERRDEAPGIILNRIAFMKKLDKDVKNLEWHTPERRRRK